MSTPIQFTQSLDEMSLSRMKWEYEVKRTGFEDLLSFGTADMDFRSPQPILDSIINIGITGHLGYPYIKDSYYQSIEKYLERIAGWKIDASKCVANNVGIYTAIWNVLDAFTEKGDEVIVQTPVHFCFIQMLKDNNRKVVENPLINDGGYYQFDLEQLEKCITPATKLLWLCNPHNPVGRAWNKEELQKIGELCIKHNLLILSDDVYCGLTFPNAQYVPIASISKDISDRTITCYSTSKSYNTTGIKFSYVVAENPEVLDRYYQSLKRLDLHYGHNQIGLEVTEAAYNHCDSWLDGLINLVLNHRKITNDFLAEYLPDFTLIECDATYFAWIDLRKSGLNANEVTALLEQEAHMIVGSGASLGTGGQDYIRLNLACNTNVLEEGLERMRVILGNVK